MEDLKAGLKREAQRAGFDLCGVTRPESLASPDYLRNWIGEGRAGDMAGWLGRDVEARVAPLRLLPEARSLIVLGLNYYQKAPAGRGRVATYALGRDYHDLIPPKLDQLDEWLSARGGVQRRAVDTSALLEKPAAMRAGLGWIGKSTMLIHPKLGTWLFLAEVLTTLELEPDRPEKDHCGSCTRCMTACPTQAITAPYELDARRCIAYLTIEHKGPIPEEFRRAIGDRVYGCDECLAVCPWNRWARETQEVGLRAVPRPDLRTMLEWDEARFRMEFRGTPLFRLKRRRWLRNICVVLGNRGTAEDLPALQRATADGDELVAEHARWAVAEIALRAGV